MVWVCVQLTMDSSVWEWIESNGREREVPGSMLQVFRVLTFAVWRQVSLGFKLGNNCSEELCDALDAEAVRMGTSTDGPPPQCVFARVALVSRLRVFDGSLTSHSSSVGFVYVGETLLLCVALSALLGKSEVQGRNPELVSRCFCQWLFVHSCLSHVLCCACRQIAG